MSKGFDSLEAATEADRFAWWLEQGDLDAMMQAYGADIAKKVTDSIISNISHDCYRTECLSLKVGRLQSELAGEAPSPIEKLLAERVAVCYLDSYYSDLLAQSNCNMIAGDFCQRRQDRAHRRYLQAVKALAECRKLEASTIRQTVEGLRLVG